MLITRMTKFALNLSEKASLAANATTGFIGPQAEALNRQAKEEGAAYPKKRFVHSEIARHLGERIFIALVGPRGAGKSTLLKQIHNKAEASFYLALDTGGAFNLFKLSKEL